MFVIRLAWTLLLKCLGLTISRHRLANWGLRSRGHTPSRSLCSSSRAQHQLQRETSRSHRSRPLLRSIWSKTPSTQTLTHGLNTAPTVVDGGPTTSAPWVFKTFHPKCEIGSNSKVKLLQCTLRCLGLQVIFPFLSTVLGGWSKLPGKINLCF